MRLIVAAAAAMPVALSAAPYVPPPPLPPRAITQALVDWTRPLADRQRDATRHPAELLWFAGAAPGQKVADFIMGGGYWTRLLSDVVGPRGRVYAYQPAEFIQFRPAYLTEQNAAAIDRPNVVTNRQSLGSFAFPDRLDLILTSQNWHDMHLKAFPPGASAAIARRLYAALKPGGTLLVIDHVGVNATPFAVADSQHRGDAAATRAELQAAGFRFDGESRLLANRADPHTASVFDPSIRGRTDQFVYRFRKPR